MKSQSHIHALSLTKRDISLIKSYSERDTPVPIPNTEVMPFCADDTSGRPRGKVGRCRETLKRADTTPVLLNT